MLTERIIRDAKAGPKALILWDGEVKGLGLRVFPSGGKAFVLSYRAGARKRLVTLARCSELSLRDARERAGAELVAIRAGETDPLERREEARTAPTVAEAVERFLGTHAERRIALGRMGRRTLAEYALQCRSVVLPAIGNRRVVDVTRADVERMVDPLKATMRNRVLALASRLFTLCETWELRPQHTNPARGIERAVENARDRTLDAEELAALAAALDAMEAASPAAIAAIRFAAVTGLRIGEVLAVQWDHVDFQTGRLVMPETKTGRRTHGPADTRARTDRDTAEDQRQPVDVHDRTERACHV